MAKRLTFRIYTPVHADPVVVDVFETVDAACVFVTEWITTGSLKRITRAHIMDEKTRDVTVKPGLPDISKSLSSVVGETEAALHYGDLKGERLVPLTSIKDLLATKCKYNESMCNSIVRAIANGKKMPAPPSASVPELAPYPTRAQESETKRPRIDAPAPVATNPFVRDVASLLAEMERQIRESPEHLAILEERVMSDPAFRADCVTKLCADPGVRADAIDKVKGVLLPAASARLDLYESKVHLEYLKSAECWRNLCAPK